MSWQTRLSVVSCFIFSKFAHCTNLQPKSILLGFYIESELEVAKDQLFPNLVKSQSGQLIT